MMFESPPLNQFRRSRHWMGVLLLMSLSACVTQPSADLPTSGPIIIEERIVIDGEALALPEDDLPTLKPLSQREVMSPVVRSLLTQARDQRRLGNWDGAVMLLERALRIEPRNAVIWSRLAHIRFDQQAWGNAIQLAAKSNTLAAKKVDLKRRNWVLMASAYEALGDEAAAQRTLDKLSQ